jgi:cytochrome c oxidase subunit 5b
VIQGAERFEAAMKTKGYNDPYDMEPLQLKAKSTKENPNVVFATGPDRVIGCICEEESHHISYMNIHLNELKRCKCGHWFTLKPRELPDLREFGLDVTLDSH